MKAPSGGVKPGATKHYTDFYYLLSVYVYSPTWEGFV